jgi:magnesium transporter
MKKIQAGGLMAKELIKVNENWSVNRCIKEIRFTSF